MQYGKWDMQAPIKSPVYLDANVLVGTTVNGHPLYPNCVKLTASLLIAKANILISTIAVDESTWATAKLAYCDLAKKPSNTKWNKALYRQNCDQIFKSHGSWITAVGAMIKDFKTAGAQIDLVPADIVFEDVLDLAPNYMRLFKLTPADAFHLAIAEKQAKTFVTADSDFDRLQQNLPPGNLTVLQIPKV